MKKIVIVALLVIFLIGACASGPSDYGHGYTRAFTLVPIPVYRLEDGQWGVYCVVWLEYSQKVMSNATLIKSGTCSGFK